MCNDLCAHCGPCETSTVEDRHGLPRGIWHDAGHPAFTPWTTREEYTPLGVRFSARELEILDEHAAELDKDLGAHGWGPNELREFLGNRAREERPDDPRLAAEFVAILARYPSA